MDTANEEVKREPASTAAAWRDRAEELAEWTWEYLVNRTDAWGGYWLDNDGSKHQTTRPHPRRRGQVLLTQSVLRQHYQAARLNDLVGLHATSPENTCKWIGLDLDSHGDGGDPAANRRAALAWFTILMELGFTPLLTGSNGRGGYHLRVLFLEPIPSELAHYFALWIVRDHCSHGLKVPPEIFPKQPRIKPDGYGNWLRLPGRHHTRDYWSAVWVGDRAVTGDEAGRHVLSITPSPMSLIPMEARKVPRAGIRPPRQSPRPTCSNGSALDRRITAYIARCPNLNEGQGRDDVAYGLACWLARDLALPDDEALTWLEQWDAGNRPPKGGDRLQQILVNAREYGQRSQGSGLARETSFRPGVRYRHGKAFVSFEVEV
jgi:hypothetical protein